MFHSVLRCVLILPALSPGCLLAEAAAVPGASFGSITIGAPVTSVPFTCSPAAEVCEGSYQSLWVRVWNTKGTIDEVDVIYLGRKFDKSMFNAPGGVISLAQAVKLHSLAPGCKPPVFAVKKIAEDAFQVIDFVNRRVYLAAGTDPESTVGQVGYLAPWDPSLKGVEQFAQEGSANLVAAANSAPLYGPAGTADTSQPAANATSAHAAFVGGIDQRVAKIKEYGELVRVSLAIAKDDKDRNGTVSEKNKDAIDTFIGMFQGAQADLIKYMQDHSDLIQDSDRAKIPNAYVKEVSAEYSKYVDGMLDDLLN